MESSACLSLLPCHKLLSDLAALTIGDVVELNATTGPVFVKIVAESPTADGLLIGWLFYPGLVSQTDTEFVLITRQRERRYPVGFVHLAQYA